MAFFISFFMCGIVGIYAKNTVGTCYFIRLADAMRTQSHRGWDGSDTFHDQRVGLANTRLAVIDIEKANQPLQDTTQRYTIVYNGEIYNYKTLRKHLLQMGYPLQTESDTEVVLYMYINYKERMFKFLDGFFSFAIYDNEEATLFIARDRLGIKPLYYYDDEDKFLFASELKALMAFNIPKEIASISQSFYFQLNYIPAPLTIFKNTYKLEPGHFLMIKKKQIIKEKYYTLPSTPTHYVVNYDEAKKKLKELLFEAVRERLQAEIPLGTFLSGGIDSSLITAIAKQFSTKLETFHLYCPNASLFDESYYSKQIAHHLNTQHHSIAWDKENILLTAKTLLSHMDEPFADASAISIYYLSKYASQYIGVALSGDGADELFGGYQKHKAFILSNFFSIPKILSYPLKNILYYLPKNRHKKAENFLRKLYRFIELYHKTSKEKYWYLATLLQEKDCASIFCNDSTQGKSYQNYKNHFLHELHRDADIRHFLKTDIAFILPNDMLYKVDFFSMANTMEVRVPFLSHAVVDFSQKIPTDYLFYKGNGKHILKDLAYELLPKGKLQNKKHGFDTPIHLLFEQSQFMEWVYEELFNQNFIEKQGVFQYKFIHKLKKQMAKNSMDKNIFWTFIVFQYWWRNKIDGDFV